MARGTFTRIRSLSTNFSSDYGEVSNVNQILNLCRSMSTSTRIFSFGLGHSPTRSLVKGLARVTNGRFVFIPPNSSVDIHVGEQLQKALQACITNVQVKWNLGTSVMSAPTKVPSMYANDRLIVYALVEDSASVFEHNSSVELYTNQQQVGEAKIDRVPNVSNDGTIARLAAKALILELQHSKTPARIIEGSLQTRLQENPQPLPTTTDEKEATKARIIELLLKYKILSTHTALVGVEKRENGSNADMILREVPIQISADDHRLQRRLHSRILRTKARILDRQLKQQRLTDMRMRRLAVGSSMLTETMCMTLSAPLMSMKMMRRLMGEEFCDTLTDTHSTTLECLADETISLPSAEALSSEEVLHKKQSLDEKRMEQEEAWPTDDQNIVRYLINKQKFDGLWELDAKIIERLTDKSLASFSHFDHPQGLISAIVIVVLETRFALLSAMWYGMI
jgi:hypothetical protein